MDETPVGWFSHYADKHWFVRDSRSSPYVRVINGVESRFNPSPELDKYEAAFGKVDTQHMIIPTV